MQETLPTRHRDFTFFKEGRLRAEVANGDWRLPRKAGFWATPWFTRRLPLRPSHSFICSFILPVHPATAPWTSTWVEHRAGRCEKTPNGTRGDALLACAKPSARQAAPTDPIFWNCAKVTRVHPRKSAGAGRSLPGDLVPLSPTLF